jgi:heat shock protein HslJ
MKLRVRLVATSLAAAALLSTACSSALPVADTPTLDGTAWVLASLPGRTLADGATATLSFDGGRAAGTDGCNRFTAPYSASRGALKFDGSPASTMMACPPGIMEQARAFMTSLGATRGYRLAGDQLQLLGPDGAVVASLAPQPRSLAGTSWRVTGYNNGRQAVVSLLDGTQMTMEFAADGRVSGSAGCNRFTGTYTLSGSSLKLGPAAATRMMCAQPDGIMTQEQQFLQALATVATIRQEGNRAELRTADGALAVNLEREAGR